MKEKAQNDLQIEEKKNKFRQFLSLYGVNKDGKTNTGQSWNDSFAQYMDNTMRQPRPAPKVAEVKEETKIEGEAKTEGENAEGGIEQQRLYVMNLSYEVT